MKMIPVTREKMKNKEIEKVTDIVTRVLSPIIKEFYESGYQEVKLDADLHEELWCMENSATKRFNYVIKKLNLQDKIRGQYCKKDGMVHLYRLEA